MKDKGGMKDLKSRTKLSGLMDEANQLTAILITCSKNAKHKRDGQP